LLARDVNTLTSGRRHVFVAALAASPGGQKWNYTMLSDTPLVPLPS